jgi:hypothetical protein
MAMKKRHYEMPADKRRGMLLSEDMSKPCGLPYGAISRDVSQHPMMDKVGMVGDLYYEVNKTMEEDSANMRSLTKPTNW